MRVLGVCNVFLLLVCFLMEPTVQQKQEDQDLHAYDKPVLATFLRFLEAQLTVAKETDPIPNGFFPFSSPNAPTFKIKRCKRADVDKCVRPGNSTNGLPYFLQGAYWQDGLQWDEELTTTYGPYDPKTRVLTIEAWKPKVWGVHDTSARKAPGQWYYLPAGASHINALVTVQATANAYLNEDLTFGQITACANLWGAVKIESPSWFLDWSMKRLPDDSWDRPSSVLGIPTPELSYVLRQVVRGDLSRGKYYDQWLKALNGRDYFYVDFA